MDYIKKLSSFTYLGNRNSRRTLLDYYSKLENPQNKLKVIHVTGTAGKGSVCRMIAKGLENSGFKVGLFVSPHMFSLNERISINGENISDFDLNYYIKYFFEKMPGMSFSEYLVLIGVEYFLREKVDFLVCEVFVGGRGDTTNIFDSVLSVITSIGVDHTNLLGETKDLILKEKLGIIRKNRPFFARFENDILLDEIRKVGARFVKVEKKCDTNLKGDFQRENAGLAFEVLKYLGVFEKTIFDSLNNINYHGRLEFLEDNILVDCAHNPLGMKALKNFIAKERKDVCDIYYLFAISRNKDFEKYEIYMKDAKQIVFTMPKIFKAENPKDYAKNGKIIENSIDAFNYLKTKLKKDDLLVVCGSIFLASEILEEFGEK